MRRLKRLIASWLPFAVSVIALVALWEALGRTLHVYFLPPASSVAAALWELLRDGTLTSALGVSLTTLVVGVALAIVLGTLIGAALSLSPRAEAAFGIYLDAAMSAPLIAFIPLLILAFGLGYPTRLVTVLVFAIFPVIVNVAAGLRTADPVLIEMGRSFGANGRPLFWEVRLPLAAPYLRTAVRVAMARGVDGLIAGEVLIATVGLGQVVGDYANAFNIEKLYAVALFIIAIALAAIALADRGSRVVLRGSG